MALRNAFADLATEATLATLLSEATFTAEDFASETTLEAARVLLASIAAEDFASQTTLAAVLAQLDVLASTRASEATLATRATEATLSNRYGGGKTAVVATVTASGSTTIHTPAPGNAVRLFWVSAITDPDESSNPLIRVLIGATEYYRAYAVAHWEVFEGAADEVLAINLSGASSVAVTAHIEEF